MPRPAVFDRQATPPTGAACCPGLPRIAVEAGVTDGWWKSAAPPSSASTVYGESAPAGVLFKHFGFTAENVADTVRKVVHSLSANEFQLSSPRTIM